MQQVLTPHGRQKLRDVGIVADALSSILEQTRLAAERQQAMLRDYEQKLPKLEWQLRTMSYGLAPDPATQRRTECEIAETRTTIAELRANLSKVQAAAEQPRTDRRHVLNFIDRMVDHIGDEGAKMRAQLGGRAA